MQVNQHTDKAIATVALFWVAVIYMSSLNANTVTNKAPVSDHGYAGAETCKTCHRDQYRSWDATFHSSMTQNATPKTVLGDFHGMPISYYGGRMRPVREQDRYYFEYLTPDNSVQHRIEITRTIGSHIYQQYLALDPDPDKENYWRLPMLWHIEKQRWVHLNGVFLGPDSQNFDQHLALWNNNCIFCHNTNPVPGLTNLDTLLEEARLGTFQNIEAHAVFDSHVGDLGIACESCHGPAANHAHENRNPLTRYAQQLGISQSTGVIHPGKLDSKTSTDICGQCHGQRTPIVHNDILQWLQTGPTFRPGDKLKMHVQPVTQETTPPAGHAPDLYALRFWPDGTPRLSAYEYQAVTQSPCYVQGDMSCLSCHSMHQGTPEDNITSEMRTQKACTQCHTALANTQNNHSGHAGMPRTPDCRDCHSPVLAYGVMGVHQSHQIEIPRPVQNLQDNRPDACTNCHIDKSVAWAQRETNRLWRLNEPVPAESTPRIIEQLLSGDPVQRAIAAHQLGQPSPTNQSMWRVPFLLIAMDDNYPMVRWFAYESLIQISQVPALSPLIEPLTGWDYIATADSRRAPLIRAFQTWRTALQPNVNWPAGLPVLKNGELDNSAIQNMLENQSSHQIHIGE